MDPAIANLKKLAQEEKWDEFRSEVDRWLDENFTNQSEGPLVEKLLALMREKSEINKKYISELDGMIKSAKKIQKDQAKTASDQKISNLKNKIDNL